MTFLLHLLQSAPDITFPPDAISWIGWIFTLGVIIGLMAWLRGLNPAYERKHLLLLGVLLAATPLTGLFIGLRLPPDAGLPPPSLPLDPVGPAVMIFSALPWIAAAGMLGPLGAGIVGAASGLVLALWETHSLFTPLTTALLAVLMAWALRQRYRTPVYRWLRHPLVAAAVLTSVYAVVYLLLTPLEISGALVARLDYALTHWLSALTARSLEMMMGALVAEILIPVLPELWGRNLPLQPSPGERSLQGRVLSNMIPLALVLIVMLTVGDWRIAWNAARNMLQERMASAAHVAAESVPYFLDSGQNLIASLASNPAYLNRRPDEIGQVLAADLRNVPFFTQLILLDPSGNTVGGYPSSDYQDDQAPIEEQMGIQNALNGVPIQSYPIAPAESDDVVQIAFIASIIDADQQVRGVLIGRSNLASNPYTQPMLAGLNDLSGEDGTGLLVDENQRIIYHPEASMLMSTYVGEITDAPQFYEDTAPDGTRRLVYTQVAPGRRWGVVLTVPAHRAQQLALQIAVPLLAVLLGVVALAVIALRVGLGVITASLHNLAQEAGRISQGQLDHPLAVEGEDEVGQLRGAFEQMRRSLKSRLDELNRLLLVSQGVAANLEMQAAVKPVLEAALAMGAASARVVLASDTLPGLDSSSQGPTSFGEGPAKDRFASLDEMILDRVRQQEKLVLPNLSRPRTVSPTQPANRPDSILALALRHENQYFGTLWMGYDHPHTFSEEEVRFFVTLASQAAIAAANAHLFQSAEVERQRLAAILASSPDPILVTDAQNRLLLANPAALQVLSLGMMVDKGKPIETVIEQPELLGLLRQTGRENDSCEVTLPGGAIYLATASPIHIDGQSIGRVCLLRDVSQFKKLDAMKSEFVATVSHDLRQPLTQMGGYTNLIEAMGPLNDPQTAYVRKIKNAVERMTVMVNDLLHQGRIESGVELQIEMTPIQDVLEKVIAEAQPDATQRKIELMLETDSGNAPLLEADPSLLERALQNLVSNAIKYTQPRPAEGRPGQVIVKVRTVGEEMLFEVSDNGIGISPVDLPRLFEKFYRGAQEGGRESRGMGMGLAIVKGVAERHGGSVKVTSTLGSGSTFLMTLPLRQPPRPVAVRSETPET